MREAPNIKRWVLVRGKVRTINRDWKNSYWMCWNLFRPLFADIIFFFCIYTLNITLKLKFLDWTDVGRGTCWMPGAAVWPWRTVCVNRPMPPVVAWDLALGEHSAWCEGQSPALWTLPSWKMTENNDLRGQLNGKKLNAYQNKQPQKHWFCYYKLCYVIIYYNTN